MSIPKRKVVRLVAERFEVEGGVVARQLVAQRGEAVTADPARAQDEAVWPLVEFELVARADADSVRSRIVSERAF